MPKEALECANIEQDLIDSFLKRERVNNPAVISDAGNNGHSILSRWIGDPIGRIDVEGILTSGKTGCLVLTEDSVRRTLFIRAGVVVGDMDGRQLKMPI